MPIYVYLYCFGLICNQMDFQTCDLYNLFLKKMNKCNVFFCDYWDIERKDLKFEMELIEREPPLRRGVVGKLI